MKNTTSSSNIKFIKNELDKSIDNVSQNIKFYCNDPISNFTRARKLPFKTIINFLLTKQAKSLSCDLADHFFSDKTLPTASAFVQQRNKILPSAIARINECFISNCQKLKTFKGYYILAQDGSDINLPKPSVDDETMKQNGDNAKFYQYHLNALFDCLNNLYYDCSIDIPAKTQEVNALIRILNNHKFPSKSIVVCDRGFESYNLFGWCINMNQKYIVRVKDINSNGILSKLKTVENEFDIIHHVKLTRKQTNEIKESPNIYTFCPSNTNISCFPIEDDFFDMDLRVVRFKISDDAYECLVTNLPQCEFNIEELKQLYHLRWNEETGFRTLKYTIGMINFSSKKRNFIQQEIWSSILLHNFSMVIANSIDLDISSKYKHAMKPKISTLVTNTKNMLLNRISIDELIRRIKKDLVPIRPDRTYKRKVIPQSAKSLNYKAA